MKARFTTPARMLGLALLLLVFSPVTAPFSTFDLVSLLGGATAPASTSVQSKKAPDEPVAAVDGQPEVSEQNADWGALRPRRANAPGGVISLHRPLRI
jgi:hypothetical protein